METTTNPLIPDFYSVIWVVAPVAVLALMIVALVSVSRTAHHSKTELIVWLAIIVFAPVLGSITWLLVNSTLRTPPTAGTGVQPE